MMGSTDSSKTSFHGRLPSFHPRSKGKRQTNWFRGRWTKPPFSGPCTTSLLVRYPYLDDRRRTATRLGLVCVSVQLQEISQGQARRREACRVTLRWHSFLVTFAGPHFNGQPPVGGDKYVDRYGTFVDVWQAGAGMPEI